MTKKARHAVKTASLLNQARVTEIRAFVQQPAYRGHRRVHNSTLSSLLEGMGARGFTLPL